MSWSNDRQLSTGGDPRSLADYVFLHEELAKLTHPARPDVDWKKVERLCLSLFQQNGVELQTACWYTQARTQRIGLTGFNEGFSILHALISRQWSVLWPPQVHARIEILVGFNQRLQQSLRGVTLNYTDLAQIYLAEKHVASLCEVLQRLELKHLSQLTSLGEFMHNAAIRLENTTSVNDVPIVLPDCSALVTSPRVLPSEQPWIYVTHEDPVTPQVMIASKAKLPLQWKGFLLGMTASLMLAGGLFGAWQELNRPTIEQQMVITLGLLSANTVPLITEPLGTGVPPLEPLDGWYRANILINQLAEKLNALDERRGQYMTVSQLKSDVFRLQQALTKKAPLEESLRQLSENKQKGSALSSQDVLQINNQFMRLMYRYSLIAKEER
ncbi:type VI secretion system ImpA family N-terminal domain-containing protein [Rouxiella silvae]|uniref:Type VI secretion system ImpA family N-terminal domain-containing protein n=1 Tax=Rouxiella silvae TaxID=1646373 RepID=A0AA40WZD4_9GAMM|nr:VasL domain-containing protein [Rouxiella silvae]MBF6635297.1 type VI secretion system ImpA family N-terminal domain-containing protein [Rouxiella silvae]